MPPPVRITASSPATDLTIQMAGPANLTGGLGGWQTIDRVDDISATDWSGQAPLTQELPLLLDGYPDGVSMESKLRDIIRLGRDVTGDENTPPILRVAGPIYFSAEENPKMRWVLPEGGIELDADSVIRDSDGTLQRQALTLTLLEYVEPGQLRARRKQKASKKTAVGKQVPLTYTTQDGDTLQSIAAAVYGKWQLWNEIGKLNGLSDPNRKLPAHKTLKLPQ